MEKGDVLPHPFTHHPGRFGSAATGEVYPVVWETLDRDVTAGSHFSYEMAKLVIDAGIVPFTLGTELHGYNVQIPSDDGGEKPASNPFFRVAHFRLTIAMPELLSLGVPLEPIVAMVTAILPRCSAWRTRSGTLAPGRIADISVPDRLSGRFRLTDNSAAEQIVDTLICPDFCLRKSERIDAYSPLVPPPALLTVRWRFGALTRQGLFSAICHCFICGG